MPVDGLAPLGARPSAGTDLTTFGSPVYVPNQHWKAKLIYHESKHQKYPDKPIALYMGNFYVRC